LSPGRDADRRPSGGGEPPLIAHVLYHLIMGGLENGLVNLVNRIPYDRYRHAIVCMAYYSDFRLRIRRPDVEVHALGVHERGVHKASPDLLRLFRRLRPAIVHSRNLAGLDGLLPAVLAGVPYRIHGEHGWELSDLAGENRKHRWNRRLHAPLVSRYIALSRHQESYLIDSVGIAPRRIEQIYNGVDVERFRPRRDSDPAPSPFPPDGDTRVIGTVGRMQGVKDPMNLVEAFLYLRTTRPDLAPRARLVMIGDGPLRETALARLEAGGASDAAWLPGAREDVAEQLRGFDVFALPSKAEGISNTILEAMATGLPMAVTRVGGNSELVLENATGFLVPPDDPQALAAALARYLEDPRLAQIHGANGRARAEAEFSLDRMVDRYLSVYDRATNH
jgi:sugar transferase (PEP-CTERM/EpsH1 system associated)